MKTTFISLLLAATALTTALAQQTAPVGLQLYSFRDAFKKDVPGTMARVKALGFREIEAAGTYGLSLNNYRKLLDQNGLKAISTGVDFEALATDLPKVIAEAKALGAKYVMCAWIPHTGDVFTQADADRAIDVFNTAGKLLAEHELKLCYHIHGYEFQPIDGGTYFDYLAQNLEPENVNFEMDVYWVKSPGQDPVALLKRFPKRFPLVHLKDRKPGTPNSLTGHADVESNVTLGTGDVGIGEFMKAAHKAGVKHFFIEDESSRAMEQMPGSLAFLRTVM